MKIEYKAVGVSGVLVEDNGEGVVTALVSVTGIKDNVNDIIMPGAYEKSLKMRTPKGVWHHDWQKSVSRTEEIRELLPGDADLPKSLPNGEPWPAEAGGLLVKTRFNLETQRGREAYADVVFYKDQQEWSIGYNVPVGGATIDSKTGVRKISTLDLYEYSPVLFGAMPVARTTSVKSAQAALQEMKTLHGDDAQTFLVEMKSLVGEDVFITEKKAIEEDEDPDDDETPDGVEEEDPEEKAAVLAAAAKTNLSPAQASSVQRAIEALQALLTGKPAEEKAAAVPVVETKSLVDLVLDAGLDDVEEKAAEFDLALESGDTKTLMQAGTAVLDAADEASKSDPHESIAAVAQYVAESIKGLPDDQEEEDPTGGAAATVDDPAKPEEPPVEGKSGTVRIEMKSIEEFLANM